jgi:hypothetical protein
MKKPKSKKGKEHKVYAIYDETHDDLAAVSLDYSVLEMQLQLGDLNKDRFSIVEFDIRLVQ